MCCSAAAAAAAAAAAVAAAAAATIVTVISTHLSAESNTLAAADIHTFPSVGHCAARMTETTITISGYATVCGCCAASVSYFGE